MKVVRWSWTPPSGVSLSDHAKMLPAMMAAAYISADHMGLFVVSPEIAAILDTLFVFKGGSSMPGGAVKIGSLRDIPVWVNLDNLENEVLVADDPYDPIARSKLVIDDLVDTTVLDRLAKL